MNCEDKFGRNHLPDMIKSATESKFIFIENSASNVDMSQLNDLCLKFGCKPRYGLSQLSPNVLSWVYDADYDNPHNAQEYAPIVFFINDLIKCFDDSLSIQYTYINEMWNDHYKFVLEKQKILQQNERKVILLKTENNTQNKSDIFTELYSRKDIVIREKDYEYNFVKIYDDFEPNSMYQFCVSNISILSGKCDRFSVLVRDTLLKKIDFIQNFEFSSGGSIFFATGENVKNKELRIYAGEPGKTNNISLKIGRSELYKFDPKGIKDARFFNCRDRIFGSFFAYKLLSLSLKLLKRFKKKLRNKIKAFH